MITPLDYKESLRDLRDFVAIHSKFKFLLITDNNANSTWYRFFSKIFNSDPDDTRLILQNIKVFKNEFDNHKIMEYLGIIVELEERKLDEGITNFKKERPYIPLIIVSENIEKKNINDLLDKGADHFINRKMFFKDSDSNKPDFETLNLVFVQLLDVLSKSLILKWFWEKSEIIKENLTKNYYDKDFKIIENEKIQERIKQKLDVAFGHLRKPRTEFEGRFDLTNEEFAFLTYWSILNEITTDWIDEENCKLKNGDDFGRKTKNEKGKEIIKTNLKSIKLPVKEIPKDCNYFKDRFPFYKFLLTYELLNDNSFSGNEYDRNLKFQIPLLLLLNGKHDLKLRIDFFVLNAVRNKLIYIHSDSQVMKKSNLFKGREWSKCSYDCAMMMNYLYLLLNERMQSISEFELNEIKRLILYNDLIARNKKGNIMKIGGKFLKFIPEKEKQPFYLIINGTNEHSEKEIKFKVKDINIKETIKNLKSNTFVNVFFSIEPNDNSQFLVVDHIFQENKSYQ